MDSAFSAAKPALALVPSLVHPDSSTKISLMVGASDLNVGAVFQQIVQGALDLLSFYL